MRVKMMFTALTLVTAALAGAGFAEEAKAGAVAAPAKEVEAEKASAEEAKTTGRFDVDVHGRLQWLGVAQSVKDDFRNDERLFLFMKQARVRLEGRYDETTFDVQWAYGGEEAVTSNVSLSLLDFSFDTPLPLGTRLRVGQFRVPYGRERMTDAGSLSFADRSIQSLGFGWNRDVGLALHAERGPLTAVGGIFTGGGRDVPQRYLPETIGSPMFVARVGYNRGMDQDAFQLRARDDRPRKKAFAIYGNALYLKDSLIGHSTVLNVRASDKSLLINQNWNPFIARTPHKQGEVWQAGGDVAVSTPVGPWMLSGEAEANYGSFSNEYGSLNIKGGRVEFGASRGPVDLHFRYAVLYPDTRMANTFTPTGGTPQNVPFITSDAPFREFTPSITYRYRSNVTVVADLRFLRDMLLVTENRLGTYVASEQPDQVTIIRPDTGFARGNVIDARLMLQFTF
jgi:hypothetical protein